MQALKVCEDEKEEGIARAGNAEALVAELEEDLRLEREEEVRARESDT